MANLHWKYQSIFDELKCNNSAILLSIHDMYLKLYNDRDMVSVVMKGYSKTAFEQWTPHF